MNLTTILCRSKAHYSPNFKKYYTYPLLLPCSETALKGKPQSCYSLKYATEIRPFRVQYENFLLCITEMEDKVKGHEQLLSYASDEGKSCLRG